VKKSGIFGKKSTKWEKMVKMGGILGKYGI